MSDLNLMDLTRTDRDLLRADRDLLRADHGATLAYRGHFCPDCGHPTLTLISLDEALTCSLCADQITFHSWHEQHPI